MSSTDGPELRAAGWRRRAADMFAGHDGTTMARAPVVAPRARARSSAS